MRQEPSSYRLTPTVAPESQRPRADTTSALPHTPRDHVIAGSGFNVRGNLLPLLSLLLFLLLLGASSCFPLGLVGVLFFCKQLQVTSCI